MASLNERICPSCRKHFIESSLSIYRIKLKDKTYRLCSYTCYNKLLKAKENKDETIYKKLLPPTECRKV